MAFWGFEVKSGRPFVHLLDKRGRLHISQATLGIGSATDKILVQCNVGDKSPVLLCSLLPGKTESCPLNLEFEEADDVMFSVIGPRSVHLTGYYLGYNRHLIIKENTESYGEDIVDTDTEECNNYSEEEDYEDSFINDGDPEVYPPSPVSNGRVENEEILDSKQPENGKGHRRLKKKYQLSESDDEDNSQQQQNFNHSTGTTVFESEDEDILPISSLCKSKKTAKQEAEEKGNKDTGETGKKNTDDNCITDTNRKADPVAVNSELERRSDPPFNSLLPSTEVVDPETGTKPKKKRKERSKRGKPSEDYSANQSNVLKEDETKQDEGKAYNMGQDPNFRNQQDQKPVNDKGPDLPCTYSMLSTEASPENGAKPKKKRKERSKERKTVETDSSYHTSVLKEEKDRQDEAKTDKISQDLSLRNEDQEPAIDKSFDNDAGHLADKKQPEEKKIKKKKKRSKTKENEGDVDMNMPLLSMEEKNRSIKNADAKTSQVRTLSNGLVIEELEKGKPDGKIASSGKRVSVRYIAKLKKNGQIFDSNIDGAPFKFHLGAGEVIKGWDVGLDGMRVGDKRRLIIPPSMGYGSEGDVENVPPNSWLVFEVELVGVR
ncbi:hypothetical protein L1049_017942 [Liquidambar formosana]|uniref:peptidylprolyl isomerase n=1 Tax=Liquidambar formosana TaxID=63359 RepID=A0AAP0R845_LIQFO